ncbi:hypothetical protein LOCC1_G001035 [Lachnellula occidentalis]|uniref:Uncharacterized protein n=1 Tax=Lachnellula occidentalis TaxID=215460 RepID=A0A8H8S930_9HELO|nr:hypothetical protein LOCC1_G001035 [Lachnellula occidentalis]
MSPVTQISQQPQPQQVEMTTPQADRIVSQQPDTKIVDIQAQIEGMTTEPEMHLRGGGMVGDWYGSLLLKFFSRF